MQRYHVGFGQGINGWAIWDHKLGRFIGDGKGEILRVDSHVQAQSIVDIMLERVGA